MTLVVGTDEAGYGPNLGPLVVAATAWRIGAAPTAVEAALEAAGARLEGPSGRPLWADSKQVLRGGTGLAALEAGALVGLATAGSSVPRNWTELAAAVGPEAVAPATGAHALEAIALPLVADPAVVAGQAAAVRADLRRQDIVLQAVRVRVVHAGEFNGLLDRGLNKSDLLSQVTLDLAAALRAGADGPVRVWCDRHGGRRRYAPLVARHFDATLVQPVEETAARSVYEVPAASCRVEFCVGGESRLPVALASMTAKYVREVLMRAFNDHWSARCPGLEPTAGYPVDAARWRSAAADAVEREGVPWDEIWRRT